MSCLFAVNVGEDCPVFDGLYEYCQLSAGGTVGKIGLQNNKTFLSDIQYVKLLLNDCIES